ncbi:hypothetical protein J6590_000220 [Homalodisca vitripennis]|nr:hypothetical protein J6590_000220 [Homalodisca vitripennis]
MVPEGNNAAEAAQRSVGEAKIMEVLTLGSRRWPRQPSSSLYGGLQSGKSGALGSEQHSGLSIFLRLHIFVSKLSKGV